MAENITKTQIAAALGVDEGTIDAAFAIAANRQQIAQVLSLIEDAQKRDNELRQGIENDIVVALEEKRTRRAENISGLRELVARLERGEVVEVPKAPAGVDWE